MTSFAFLEQLWIARYVIMTGLATTVSISLLAIVAGSLFGVLVGLALVYGGRVLRWHRARLYGLSSAARRCWCSFWRATTCSLHVGVDLGPVPAGVLALAVFCSSHVGEIVRGALQSIPKGQTEAAKAIGLTFPQTFAYVLGPQALRQVLPPGSIRPPRWSRPRRFCRSSAWPSFCSGPRS
jgi:polar amino acid transport system permease protein